jgi:hypothetical protein
MSTGRHDFIVSGTRIAISASLIKPATHKPDAALANNAACWPRPARFGVLHVQVIP